MKIIDVPQSGNLGTYISFKNRFGQFRRRYVVPRDPRTPAQLGVRSRFGRISARWRVLTDEQRAAWSAFSAEVASRGRLGKSGPLTGCQLFVKINTNLAFVGMDQVVDPPDYPRFTANPVGKLSITNTRGVIAPQAERSHCSGPVTLLCGGLPRAARGRHSPDASPSLACCRTRSRASAISPAICGQIRRAAGGEASVHPHTATDQRLAGCPETNHRGCSLGVSGLEHKHGELWRRRASAPGAQGV